MISDNEIPLSKILRPTYEEFVDFAQYVETLDDKSLQNYGLVKVVPPAKWKARKTPIDFDSFVVNAPIEQNVQGKSGIYELLLIQKKSMKLPDYKKKVECFDSLTNDKPIEDVEDMFWRSLAFSPPLYGADMLGSLFDVGAPWNLNELPGVLKEGLKNPISGVNHPYLYVGSWKTMFGWHKEDLDLFSINYLHHGKPKFWYGIPASEGKKLENFARSYFPEGFSKCKEFLRHKTIMIHPYILKQKIPDLKIHKMVQYPGEFMITIGGAYHAGFNWGFNIAEAVNFATTKWLEILPSVRACTCINDSVKIGKEAFYYNMLESPTYGKMNHVKKICNDQGIFLTKPVEQDEVESTETTDSREVVQQPARRTRSKSSDVTTQYKELPSRLTRNAGSRVKTISKKTANESEDGEDETPRQRMSNRSKKIKKLGEEFDTSDWKKNQKPKKGQVQHLQKGRLRKVKDLGEVSDDQDLIPFDDDN